jgi:hypothetical protein
LDQTQTLCVTVITGEWLPAVKERIAGASKTSQFSFHDSRPTKLIGACAEKRLKGFEMHQRLS